jgi:ABC-type bacteriocin/lantibiotic exporter with double-glycine peptidase domain
MEAVIQEEATGCGLACVAMLAGESYSAVRAEAAVLGIRAEDERLWSDTGHVRRLLAHYGIATEAGETPFRGWTGLPERALLATKHHVEGGRPFWHWCVFNREPDGAVVLDPAPYLAANRRTDWAATEPAWFIAVRGNLPARP